jgi:hypothetical protein
MSDPLADFLEICDRIPRLKDPSDRAIARAQALAAIPALQKYLREGRQADVLEMRADGMTDVEIGEKIGLSWARVSAVARGVSSGGNDIRRRKAAEQRDAPPAGADGA